MAIASGLIREANSLRPIGFVALLANGSPVGVSDPEGKFSVPLPMIPVKLEVRSPQYEPASVMVNVDNSNITFTLKPAWAI